MSLADLRDIVVIVYGVMGILLFTALIIVTIAIFLLVRTAARSVTRLVEDPVRPTLEEVQQTARTARGAADFYADQAVRPVIKVVATVRGVRRGLKGVTGLARRVRPGGG